MTTETVCVPRELLLELRDTAYVEAQQYHEAMQGYRQHEHDRLDKIVADVDALLAQPVASEPVAWQWLNTAHFRRKIPAYANPYHWEPLYRHPQARAVPEGWIPVSERLPEIGTEVLVYCPHKIKAGRNPVTALVRLIRHEGAIAFYWDNNYGGSNIHLQESVTHWMPLAAAPQPTEEPTDE